jgi:hypothetical protein
MVNDKRSNRRGGFYWIKDKPYVSVTQVLRVIDKPALRWWFGNQIYLAMVKDPSLDEQSAMSAPYAKSQEAKGRGTTVHSVIEAFKKTGVIIKEMPDRFDGYTKAFYSWIWDNKVDLVEQEKTVVSEKYRYAGTLDILCKLNGSDDLIVVDAKTSKDGAVYDEAELQVTAYMNALREGGVPVNSGYVLGLGENGTYNFKKVDYQLIPFLAAKTLWVWQNKAKCKTVGYTEE